MQENYAETILKQSRIALAEAERALAAALGTRLMAEQVIAALKTLKREGDQSIAGAPMHLEELPDS
jgi:hypothetical protein